MVTRRRCLAGLGAAGVALAGCVDILPALKGEDSSVGRRAEPTSPGCQLAGLWTLLRPFAQGVAGWVSARSGPHHRTAVRGPHARPGFVGHGPCHRPFSTVEATWSRPTGRGLLFGCRRDAVAAASETPSRERYGSLRRPGGTQSNRQFCPCWVVECPTPGGMSVGRAGRTCTARIPALKDGALRLSFT